MPRGPRTSPPERRSSTGNVVCRPAIDRLRLTTQPEPTRRAAGGPNPPTHAGRRRPHGGGSFWPAPPRGAGRARRPRLPPSAPTSHAAPRGGGVNRSAPSRRLGTSSEPGRPRPRDRRMHAAFGRRPRRAQRRRPARAPGSRATRYPPRAGCPASPDFVGPTCGHATRRSPAWGRRPARRRPSSLPFAAAALVGAAVVVTIVAAVFEDPRERGRSTGWDLSGPPLVLLAVSFAVDRPAGAGPRDRAALLWAACSGRRRSPLAIIRLRSC